MRRNFREMLEAKWAEGKFVCVGLDPDMAKIPEHLKVFKWDLTDDPERHLQPYETIRDFNEGIITVTKDLVCAYKPNLAFYLAHGEPGLRALHKTIIYIRALAPTVPVILDAKCADIGDTNKLYVEAYLKKLGADAVTVHPYLGESALAPFLAEEDKGIIVLCRTTNPGSEEFQKLITLTKHPADKPGNMSAAEWLQVLRDDALPLYQRVAVNVARNWNKRGNCQLVVGATFAPDAKEVRVLVNDVPFLIPGIGKQGGDLEATVLATMDNQGVGMIINSSSGIIHAASDERYAEAARAAAVLLHESTCRIMRSITK